MKSCERNFTNQNNPVGTWEEDADCHCAEVYPHSHIMWQGTPQHRFPGKWNMSVKRTALAEKLQVSEYSRCAKLDKNYLDAPDRWDVRTKTHLPCWRKTIINYRQRKANVHCLHPSNAEMRGFGWQVSGRLGRPCFLSASESALSLTEIKMKSQVVHTDVVLRIEKFWKILRKAPVRVVVVSLWVSLHLIDHQPVAFVAFPQLYYLLNFTFIISHLDFGQIFVAASNLLLV